MLLKSKFFRLSFALTLALSLSLSVFADTIRLKDGSIIKGKITSFGGGRFTVVINDGTRQRQLDFNASEIDSISFDSDSGVRTSTENSGRKTESTTAVQSNQPISQPKNNPSNTPVLSNRSPTSAGIEQPITINVKVLADNTSNGWTNSGFVVQKGQRVRISGAGRVSLGGGRYTAPDGIASLPDVEKLMKNQPTGGLIAVVGDDNNEFFFIGNTREFIASRDGALFLGVNEGNLDDNSGVFDVKIEIYPKN